MTTAHIVPTWQLHHRLSLALEVSGVSPEEMADELGVHVNSIYNYATGRRRPKLGMVKLWADACKVDRQWLITGNSSGSDGDAVTLGKLDQLDLFDLLSADDDWHPCLAEAA